MDVVKPPRLREGDIVGIAGPAHPYYPGMEGFLKLGCDAITRLGLRTKFGRTALSQRSNDAVSSQFSSVPETPYRRIRRRNVTLVTDARHGKTPTLSSVTESGWDFYTTFTALKGWGKSVANFRPSGSLIAARAKITVFIHSLN